MKTCFFNSGFKFKNFKVLDNRNGKEKSELKTSNKIIIGFSAGSMNCSEEVYSQPELQGESLDPNYKRFLKGLGITKSLIQIVLAEHLLH